MPARLTPLGAGPTIILDKPIILVGRHPDCDAIIPSSGKVSRRHCCFVQINDRYKIRDLGSMNGVRVNGTRVIEAELNPGDAVSVGDVQFTFRLEQTIALKASMRANGTVVSAAPPVAAIPAGTGTDPGAASNRETHQKLPKPTGPKSLPPVGVPPVSVPPKSVPPQGGSPHVQPPKSIPPKSQPPKSLPPKSLPPIGISPGSSSMSVPPAAVSSEIPIKISDPLQNSANRKFMEIKPPSDDSSGDIEFKSLD